MVLQFLNQNYLNYSFFLNDIIIYLEFLEISFLLFKKTQVFNLNNFFIRNFWQGKKRREKQLDGFNYRKGQYSGGSHALFFGYGIITI